MSECIGEGCGHSSHNEEPEKVSSWTEEERERTAVPSAQPRLPGAKVQVPLPVAGDTFPLRGFQWTVRAVDAHPPYVAVVLEPTGPTKSLRKILREAQ